MTEQHKLDDLDRVARNLESVRYQFRVTARDWQVRWRGMPVGGETIFEDNPILPEKELKDLQHRNMEKAVSFALDHMKDRIAQREKARIDCRR